MSSLLYFSPKKDTTRILDIMHDHSRAYYVNTNINASLRMGPFSTQVPVSPVANLLNELTPGQSKYYPLQVDLYPQETSSPSMIVTNPRSSIISACMTWASMMLTIFNDRKTHTIESIMVYRATQEQPYDLFFIVTFPNQILTGAFRVITDKESTSIWFTPQLCDDVIGVQYRTLQNTLYVNVAETINYADEESYSYRVYKNSKPYIEVRHSFVEALNRTYSTSQSRTVLEKRISFNEGKADGLNTSHKEIPVW